MCGVASLEEAREAFLHVVDAALLCSLARAAVSQDIIYVELIRGQLDGSYAFGEVLEFRLPPLNDFLEVVCSHHLW